MSKKADYTLPGNNGEEWLLAAIRKDKATLTERALRLCRQRIASAETCFAQLETDTYRQGYFNYILSLIQTEKRLLARPQPAR